VSRYLNLVNPAFRPRRLIVSAGRLALAAASVAAGLIAADLWLGRQAADLQAQAKANEAQLAGMRERLAAIGRQAASYRPDAELSRRAGEAETLLRIRESAVAALDAGAGGSATGFSEIMRALARQSIDGLWLTGFTIDSGGAELSLAGRALDADLLPAYITRLGGEAVMRGRAFAALKLGEPNPIGTDAKASAAPASAGYVEFRLASRAGGSAERK
jgi:hypothetical protein